MNFEGGPGNGRKKTGDLNIAPPQPVKSFEEMGSKLGIERKKPKRGRRNKSERQETRRERHEGRKDAIQFRHEIDAEIESILRHAQLGDCQGNLSTELRAENGKYEIEIEITNAVLPENFDLKYAADRIKNRIESDPRNPNGVTCLVRIARARDRNREALEKAQKSPQYSLAAQQEMLRQESEKRTELLDKLAEQLVRDGFPPHEDRREIFYRVSQDAKGTDIFEVVCDNEELPQSIQHTIQKLSLLETRLLTGSRVLVQRPDGTIAIESREVGARISGEATRGDEAEQVLDNTKVELFPKLRPRLKEFALGVGTANADEDDRVQLLARVVAAEMTEALDDILRLEKSSGKKGKALARTNMIGGTTLFNRLQRLGLIDATATQIDQAKIQNHLLDYLNNGNDAKENFVVALHNISSRFKKSSREKVFPRDPEALQARILELGLSPLIEAPKTDALDSDPPPASEEWRLALGVHPDADGEGVPRILRRPLGPNPNPIVTAEHAAFLRDIDAVKRMESAEGALNEEEDPSLLVAEYRRTISALEAELEKLGSRTPEQARTRIEELEYEKDMLEAGLSKVTSDLSVAQDEITGILASLNDERQQKVEAENRAIDQDIKINELTVELQRVEAKHAILEVLIRKLPEVADDADAVKRLANEAADALRIVDELKI